MLRGFSKCICRSKYTLPDLPYDYNALEPVISTDIMQVHHGKHHAAYVSNLNTSIEQLQEALHANNVPAIAKIQSAVAFNAGGNLNHSIFWKNLCPKNKAKGRPSGQLIKLIEAEFGSFEQFIDAFSKQTLAIQGSGWGWLAYNKQSDRVEFAATGNQEVLYAKTGLHPLLTVDVWEHAYYLQYKNARVEFLKHIWSIVNWDDVTERLNEVKSIDHIV